MTIAEKMFTQKTINDIQNHPYKLYMDGLVMEKDLPELRRRARLAAFWWERRFVALCDALKYAAGAEI